MSERRSETDQPLDEAAIRRDERRRCEAEHGEKAIQFAAEQARLALELEATKRTSGGLSGRTCSCACSTCLLSKYHCEGCTGLRPADDQPKPSEPLTTSATEKAWSRGDPLWRTGRRVWLTLYRKGIFVGSCVNSQTASALVDDANRGAAIKSGVSLPSDEALKLLAAELRKIVVDSVPIAYEKLEAKFVDRLRQRSASDANEVADCISKSMIGNPCRCCARRTSKDQAANGCPCLVIEPCGTSCTCANPIMSGGCQRCARYGSPEQRRAAAEGIAERLRSGSAPPLDRDTIATLFDSGVIAGAQRERASIVKWLRSIDVLDASFLADKLESTATAARCASPDKVAKVPINEPAHVWHADDDPATMSPGGDGIFQGGALSVERSSEASPVIGECDACDDFHWCFPGKRRERASADSAKLDAAPEQSSGVDQAVVIAAGRNRREEVAERPTGDADASTSLPCPGALPDEDDDQRVIGLIADYDAKEHAQSLYDIAAEAFQYGRLRGPPEAAPNASADEDWRDIASMTDAEVDAELRAAGADPTEVGDMGRVTAYLGMVARWGWPGGQQQKELERMLKEVRLDERRRAGPSSSAATDAVALLDDVRRETIEECANAVKDGPWVRSVRLDIVKFLRARADQFTSEGRKP